MSVGNSMQEKRKLLDNLHNWSHWSLSRCRHCIEPTLHR